jgi:hypothetical protein
LGALIFLALILTVITPDAGIAQSVSGSVFDQSGAAMPNASVTLRKGADVKTAVTNDAGRFTFDHVSAGAYDVSAEQQGFKSATTRVVVGNRSPRPLEFKLQLANLQQQITVDADEVQVSTDTEANADVTNLDRNALDNAPIFDGDYISTISRFLDSGAIGTNGTSLIVDGLEVNTVALSSSAIKEVKINQNPYSPEFMRPGRGRIEIVTKPGASAYHGTVNFVFRDNRTNAREPFATTRPFEQRKNIEMSLSGPLASGKTSSFVLTGNYRAEDAQAVIFAYGPAGLIQQNWPTPQRNANASARINHQFGENNTVSLRFESQDQYSKGQGIGATTLPEAGRSFRHREDAFFYNHTTTFSPKWVNEFRILFGKEYEPTRSYLAVPRIVVLDSFTGGGAQSDRLQTEYHTSFHDAVSWSQGKHTLKFGMDVPDISRRGLEDHSNFQGTFTFSSLSDFLQNQPFSFLQQAGNGKVIFWEKVLAGFVLDDIRVKPNLTISLAARYDRQNYFHDNNNLSPRIAFAFAPASHSKTVFRGGAGFFYDRSGAGPIFDLLRYDGQHLSQYLIEYPSYPNSGVAGTQVQATPSNIVTLSPTVRIPYTLQFGIGVEQQLRKSTTLTVNYVGTRGVGMFRSRDLNAPLPPFYSARPNLNFGQLRQIESSGNFESHSLEVALRGKVTRMFDGMMQYSFGHAYSDTNGIGSFPANNYNLTGEWGRADFDQRHRFNLLGTIHPTKLFSLGIGMFLNTGRPYSLTTGKDNYLTGMANARPAGVGRNTLEGPGYAEYDLRWFRDFKLAKERNQVAPTLTVSIDAFNIFNQTNFTNYVGNMSSPFFGKSTNAAPPRRLQFSGRFNF